METSQCLLKRFFSIGHLLGKSMPYPSTPLLLFSSSPFPVLVRTFNNVGPYIYPWGMLLITIQTAYCGSQDTEPSDAAGFLRLSPLPNSCITGLALGTPRETLSSTWLERRCPTLPQQYTKPGSNQFDQALFVSITWLQVSLDLGILCHLPLP